jgi:ABC-type lipoprotein export system ATPase subunit
MDTVLELEHVTRTYGHGPDAVHALRDSDARLYAHSLTAVIGPSGCGKSTFLQCAAGLGTHVIASAEQPRTREPGQRTTPSDRRFS